MPYFFSVYFEDPNQAATYNIDLSVSYTDYPTVNYIKSFTVLVEPSCTPTSVVSSTAPATENYVIGTPMHITTPFDPFTTSPFWCTVSYVISITPTPTAGLLDFTYNGDEIRTWDVYGTDVTLSGPYTITVDAEDHVRTIYTGWSFTVTIEDPCASSTATIDPTILSTLTLTYSPYDPILTEIMDPDKVVVTNPYFADPLLLDSICPFIIEFNLDYLDNSGAWQTDNYPAV